MSVAAGHRLEHHPSGDPNAGSELTVVLDTRVVCGTGGGPEKTILNSPRFLRSDGYQMLCGYMHPPRDPGFEHLLHRAQELQAPLISIPDRGPWDWNVVRELVQICRQERVAIWHGHDYKSNALGLLIRRYWPMRLVTTVHGWVRFSKRTPLYYAIDRMSLPYYERVICVSQDLEDRCLKAGVSADRVVLIENGIDTAQFRRKLARPEAKRALGVPAGRLLIGATGRLSPEKGFDLLIEAVSLLLGAGHDIELHIAGEGDDRARLEQLIARLGHGDRIKLLGFKRDLSLFYEALDGFALSSLREGLPNVLLEAMALEVPVVATRINGIPRLVRDGESGRLVEAGSVEALAGGLRDLITSDPGRLGALGVAGRRVVERDFSFAHRMHKIARLYDEMLGRTSTGRPLSA